MSTETNSTPPPDFGWVVNGWVERLFAVEQANKAVAGLNPIADGERFYSAQWDVYETQGELHRYRDEMVRGLSLVLRWLLEGSERDILTRLLSNALHDLVKVPSDDYSFRLKCLENEIEGLRERLEEVEGCKNPSGSRTPAKRG